MNSEVDYYQILQAEPGSSIEDLKQQYRRLAKIYHPDRNPGEEEWCVEQLKKVNEAFTYLSDPARKAIYDRTRTSSTGRSQGFHSQSEFRPGGATSTQERPEPPFQAPPVTPRTPTPPPNPQPAIHPMWIGIIAVLVIICVYGYQAMRPSGPPPPVFVSTTSPRPAASHPSTPAAATHATTSAHHVRKRVNVTTVRRPIVHRTLERQKPVHTAATHHSAPSAATTEAIADRIERQGRIASARRLKHMGVSVSPNSANLSQLRSYEAQVRAARAGR